MIRRIALIAAALVVVGIGGMTVYATTLPAEDVLNDAAGRVCHTILVNRQDLPATPDVQSVVGIRMDLSLEAALRLSEDLKKTDLGAYQAAVLQTKEAYSNNIKFYQAAVVVRYVLSGDPASAPASGMQCWFAVTIGPSGDRQSRLAFLSLTPGTGGSISMGDPEWQGLVGPSGLSPSGYVRPTLLSQVRFLLSPIYEFWRVGL
jgi:hypothetical protein